MKQQLPCDDKALLIAYLYDECDAAERRVVEQHLATCATCAAELEQLRGVRGALREWAPPEAALGFRVVRDGAPLLREAERKSPASRWWAGGMRVPAWAQLAAAVLVLAVGAAMANLDVRIGSGMLTIRTGWQKAPVAASATPSTDRAAGGAPWRADLAALKDQLRQEISAMAVSTRTVAGTGATAAAPVAGVRLTPEDRATVLRQVQAMVGDMERRQQGVIDQQIAQRFLRLAHDVDTQRIADQRRFMQGLSQIDVRTNQMSQVQNYLLRVANVQEIK